MSARINKFIHATLLFLFTFAFTSTSAFTAYAQSWDELAASATGGGVSNNAGGSGYPSLALDSSGNPHIAWYDDSGSDLEIYYRYWNPPIPCQCPPNGAKGCISGTVTEVGTGAPLVEKMVWAWNKKGRKKLVVAVTDANGCYIFDGLGNGVYDVSVCAKHQVVGITGSKKVNNVDFQCR